MSVLRLTVQARPGQPRNTRRDELDGRIWSLSWYTSEPDDTWYLDLVSDGGEAIYAIPVSPWIDMLAPYRAVDVPPGALWCQTTHGRAPRQDDFSAGRAVVYYEEAAA